MFLSKSCLYGIRSVLFLALSKKRREYISIKEISRELEIPFHYLTKILQILNHKGIVKSVKGPKGGVSFNKAPEKISLYEIIAAIDGDPVFNQCFIGDVKCSSENPCVLHRIIYDSRTMLQKNLKQKNVKQAAAGFLKADLKYYNRNRVFNVKN